MKKNLMFFAFVIIASYTSFGGIFGDDVIIETRKIDGHVYITARTDDSRGGISIIHSESCPCKEKKTEFEKRLDTQGPRLFSKSMRLRKYEEQKGICVHCTNHFEFVEMQGDHIIPYSKGGKTEYSNLQMLCIPCNRKKSNKYSY